MGTFFLSFNNLYNTRPHVRMYSISLLFFIFGVMNLVKIAFIPYTKYSFLLSQFPFVILEHDSICKMLLPFYLSYRIYSVLGVKNLFIRGRISPFPYKIPMLIGWLDEILINCRCFGKIYELHKLDVFIPMFNICNGYYCITKALYIL